MRINIDRYDTILSIISGYDFLRNWFGNTGCLCRTGTHPIYTGSQANPNIVVHADTFYHAALCEQW